jgi:hypothetical protein
MPISSPYILANEAMTLLARLIAKQEGFGIPGAIPTTHNSPGDLRHAPHASHEGEGSNDIGIEPTVADGWADLERQLKLYAERGLTLRQAIYEFAPPEENNSEQYLADICRGLGLLDSTPVAQALTLQ